MNYLRLIPLVLVMLVTLVGCSGSDNSEPATPTAAERIILVTGATGTQGGAVARELLERGFAIRALTRSPDKPAAKALAALGATVYQGEYDDADSLVAAMDGVYGAFLVTDWWEHGVKREVIHGKRLVDAAKAAQLQHVVFTSVANADRATGIPHFDSKYEIEQYLRHSKLGYSVIRPVSFMNNWLWRKDEFLSGEIREPYDPSLRHQWVAAADIGFFVGEAFSNPDEWRGRALDIAGDQMSFGDFSTLLSEVFRRPVEYRRVSWGEYESAAGAESTQMARWFDGVGYSVDVAALRERYPGLTTAKEFLNELNWVGDTNED